MPTSATFSFESGHSRRHPNTLIHSAIRAAQHVRPTEQPSNQSGTPIFLEAMPANSTGPVGAGRKPLERQRSGLGENVRGIERLLAGRAGS